jgi:hypothetical protein
VLSEFPGHFQQADAKLLPFLRLQRIQSQNNNKISTLDELFAKNFVTHSVKSLFGDKCGKIGLFSL